MAEQEQEEKECNCENHYPPCKCVDGKKVFIIPPNG